VEAHARFSGTLEEPLIKGNIQSAQVSVGNQPVGPAAAHFTWQKNRFDVSDFHLDPGVTGRYSFTPKPQASWDLDLHFKDSPGILLGAFSQHPLITQGTLQGTLHAETKERLSGGGSLTLKDFNLGKWPLTESSMRFELKPQRLEITDLTAQSQKDLRAQWKGSLSWEKDAGPASPLTLQGAGILHAPVLVEQPDIPFDLSGQFSTPEKTLHGDLHVKAHALGGLLQGVYTFAGTADRPEAAFTAHVDNAHWRAFNFSTDLKGRWSVDGIKPLTLNGQFKTGGDFQFNGMMNPNGQAQGSVKLDHFNLRPLGDSLRFPKSLDGLASATLTLSGPLVALRWNGHLEGGPLTYAADSEHPFTLQQFAMDMTLAPLENDASITHLTLNEGQAKTAEELIRFRPGSFVEFAGAKPARLALGTDIRNLHLGIFTLFGGLDVDGTWQIKPEGFAIQTQAGTHSLFINDYELEEGILRADYYNGVLQFSAPPNSPALVTGTINFHNAPQLNFKDFFISGKDRQGLQLSGDIGPTLWDFRMTGRALDMGILAELAGFPYPISGSADVQVHGTGDPKHPHVDGKVDLNQGSVLGLSFRSGSAAFIWQDTRITFTKLLLSDPGHYNLEGSGSFPLLPKDKAQTQDHSVDFSVRLRDSNLSLLQSFSREVKSAKGPVEGLLQIKGTMEDPDLHGSLKVTNGEIVGAHYFRQLRNANLTLNFDGDTVKILDLRGKSGDGEFKGSGSVTLAGFAPAKYDLQLDVVSAKGLDVQVPELAIPESPLAKRFKFLTTASHTDVRGHVALRGPAEAPIFSGEGLFTNGHFTFPPSHKNPPSPALLEWFRRITWDVNLKFQDGAWFENELIQANITGNLALKGPSDKLRVDGGLDITEGKISYLGLQFDIRQAHFDLRSETSGDSVVNTPYLRGEAECQVQAVDTVSGVAGASGGSRLSLNDNITLNIDYAPIDQIKPRLTSAANPTLSQEKLLARVTQTDIENLTPQERTYLYQKQIVSMIDSSLATPLAQNVLKKTGLADRLRVEQVFDPNNSAPQDLNTTATPQQQSTAVNLFANKKYTVEKDLSNRLSLGYGVRFVPTISADLDATQQKLDLISDVQLSYRWFRNVYLRGDFDLPTSNPNILPERKVTIEPRWRFGWWGNTNKDKEKPKPAP